MALFGNGLHETPEQRRLREMMEGGAAPSLGIGIDTGGPAQAPQRQPGFWNGGDKFSARDGIAAALAAIGDAFAQRGGGQGGAVDMLTGGRMSEMKLVRDAQQRQQERQEGREDFSWQLGQKAKYATPETRNFEDNAGNQWTVGADGQPRLVYADPIPKMYIQGDQAVQISNPFAQARQPQGMADLPEGYSIRGGAASPAPRPFPPRLPGMPRRRR